jgi:hypothetical protein
MRVGTQVIAERVCPRSSVGRYKASLDSVRTRLLASPNPVNLLLVTQSVIIGG